MFVRVTCTWALSLWSLLLICTWDATALEVVRQGSPCGPNEVPWPSEDGAFHCEAFEEAWKRAEAFLNDNMPPWDLLNRGTLQLGLLPATVTQALQVRQNFSWAAEVPEEIWLNYVLPYASVNEARTDWRRLLFEALKIDAAKRSLAEVTQLVNEKLWSAVRNDTTIVFKAQQTPLIYDTMSAIAFGYASCTGLSIMFLDALRSVGVPARLVGTPAWHGTFADGNHNWVEIWLGHGSGLFGEAWTFLEASPAGPGEHLLNPCDKWFCNPSHFDGKTMSFAAKFDREKEKFNYYPMAWDMENKDIPGVNRTDFYIEHSMISTRRQLRSGSEWTLSM